MAAPKIIDNQTGNGWSAVVSSTFKGIGQSFTTGAYPTNIEMVRVALQYRWGDGPMSPAQNLVCKIYAQSSDLPSGSALATSLTSISTNTIERADGGGSPNYSFGNFYFDKTLVLSASTKYVFIVGVQSTISDSVIDGLTDSTNSYDGGILVRERASSYSSVSGYDIYFEIYGSAVASASPIAATSSIPEVAAEYSAIWNASVSPVTAALSAITPVATYVQQETSSVSPIAATSSIPEVAAGFVEQYTALLSPLSLTADIASVIAFGISFPAKWANTQSNSTPWDNDSIQDTQWTDTTIVKTNWN